MSRFFVFAFVCLVGLGCGSSVSAEGGAGGQGGAVDNCGGAGGELGGAGGCGDPCSRAHACGNWLDACGAVKACGGCPAGLTCSAPIGTIGEGACLCGVGGAS